MTKNVVILMDGTWDNILPNTDSNNIDTNIAKLNHILINNTFEQLVYYDDGVGADAYGLSKLIDGATGLGINDKIIQGYQFIMQHFTNGDNIYLFGFSRGAYTVRYIADFIAHLGLLKLIDNETSSQQLSRINDYFNQYKQIRNSITTKIDLALANNCTIQMLGVFDTVGALGIPLSFLKNLNSELYNFSDTILHDNVLFGYQALAIDEKRTDFTPCLWSERNGIEQVWFSGSHSDIGGGYKETGLSDISLAWMINAMIKHNLIIDQEKFHNLSPNPLGQIHDPSTSFPYNILSNKARTIPEKSLIKDSVKIRILDKSLNYNPPNLPIAYDFIG